MSNCDSCDSENKDDKKVCCQPPNCRYIPPGVKYMIDIEGHEKTKEGRCLKITPRDISRLEKLALINSKKFMKKDSDKRKSRKQKRISRKGPYINYSITPGKFDYLSDFVLQLSPKEKKRMEKLFIEPELEKRLHQKVKIIRPKSLPAIPELSSEELEQRLHEKVEVPYESPVIPAHVPLGALEKSMNRSITWARKGRNKKKKTQRKHKIKRKSKRNKINRLSKRKIKRLSKRKIKHKSKRKTR